MTKRQLSTRVYLTVAYFLLLIGAAIISYIGMIPHSMYEFIHELSSIFIALPAAYLTYCLQRRQAHLTSLRELWKEANEAKNEIVQYSHLADATAKDFAQAHKAISKAIDSVRAVYRNVGETDKTLGLYPFEPLHDMCDSLERLYPNKLNSDIRATERKKMISAWNAFRWAFLSEFQAPAAPRPVTNSGVIDPRRCDQIQIFPQSSPTQ